MQTGKHDDDGSHHVGEEPANSVHGEMPPRPQAEERAEEPQNESANGARRLKPSPPHWRRWLTLGYGSLWQFESRVNPFEAAGIIVGVIGVYLLFQQIRQTDEAVQIAREANALASKSIELAQDVQRQSAADAAEQAARNKALDVRSEQQLDLARNGAEGARMAMQLERRAWIGMEQGSLTVEVGKPVTVTVAMQNSGVTPGLNLRSSNYLTIIEKAKQFRPTYPESKVTDSAALFPGMATTAMMATPFVLQEEMAAKLKSGDLIVYAYGRLTYQDVFGQDRESGFCMFVAPDLKGLRFCGEHNYAH